MMSKAYHATAEWLLRRIGFTDIRMQYVKVIQPNSMWVEFFSEDKVYRGFITDGNYYGCCEHFIDEE